MQIYENKAPGGKVLQTQRILINTLIPEIQVNIQSKVQMSHSKVDFLMIIYIAAWYYFLNSNYKLTLTKI